MRYLHWPAVVLRWVSLSLGLVSGLAIGFVGLLTVADVVGRAFFGYPVTGTVEITKTSVVAIGFLAAPFAMRQRSHVRSTLVVQRVPFPVEQGLRAFAYLLGVALFILIAVASWGPAVSAWVNWEYEGEGALRVPIAPTRTAIVAASIVMSLECLSALMELARRNMGSPRGHTP